MLIELSKGLDIPVAGAPAQAVAAGSEIFSVALQGDDYRGLKPRLTVEVGDGVRPGQEASATATPPPQRSASKPRAASGKPSAVKMRAGSSGPMGRMR